MSGQDETCRGDPSRETQRTRQKEGWMWRVPSLSLPPPSTGRTWQRWELGASTGFQVYCTFQLRAHDLRILKLLFLAALVWFGLFVELEILVVNYLALHFSNLV